MEQTISVNMEYLVKQITERIELDLTFRKLHNSINAYCIEVTGKEKEHILFDEVIKMFPNSEIIDYTINYANSCIDGLNKKELHHINNIIDCLYNLKVIYQDQTPF